MTPGGNGIPTTTRSETTLGRSMITEAVETGIATTVIEVTTAIMMNATASVPLADAIPMTSQ